MFNIWEIVSLEFKELLIYLFFVEIDFYFLCFWKRWFCILVLVVVEVLLVFSEWVLNNEMFGIMFLKLILKYFLIVE